MEIKSVLNSKLEKEVYVEQPPIFIDSKYPNHVYKLDIWGTLWTEINSLDTWYETLASSIPAEK